MSERLAYQYVVLKCVPRVDRGESINVGVVLYSQMADFLEVACHVDRARLAALWPALDTDAVTRSLEFIERVSRGDAAGAAGGGPAAQPMSVRFGFIKAPRSTVVQPGPVHGGVTVDPAAELQLLLDRLVRP